MTRTGTIVQGIDNEDVDAVTIMDLDTYETFGVDVPDDVGPLSEDDEVVYEEDSSGAHKWTILSVNE